MGKLELMVTCGGLLSSFTIVLTKIRMGLNTVISSISMLLMRAVRLPRQISVLISV